MDILRVALMSTVSKAFVSSGAAKPTHLDCIFTDILSSGQQMRNHPCPTGLHLFTKSCQPFLETSVGCNKAAPSSGFFVTAEMRDRQPDVKLVTPLADQCFQRFL
jgi:hypothetical protein